MSVGCAVREARARPPARPFERALRLHKPRHGRKTAPGRTAQRVPAPAWRSGPTGALRGWSSPRSIHRRSACTPLGQLDTQLPNRDRDRRVSALPALKSAGHESCDIGNVNRMVRPTIGFAGLAVLTIVARPAGPVKTHFVGRISSPSAVSDRETLTNSEADRIAGAENGRLSSSRRGRRRRPPLPDWRADFRRSCARARRRDSRAGWALASRDCGGEWLRFGRHGASDFHRPRRRAPQLRPCPRRSRAAARPR